MTNRELAELIIDKFEDLLNKYGIKIPDNNRENNENEAAIYGTNYYDLEDEITAILNKQNAIKNVRHNIKTNTTVKFCNNHSFYEIKHKDIRELDYEKAHSLLYAENRTASISAYLGVYNNKFELIYSIHGKNSFEDNYENVISEEVNINKINNEKEFKKFIIEKLDKFYIEKNKLIYTLSRNLEKQNNIEEETEELEE